MKQHGLKKEITLSKFQLYFLVVIWLWANHEGSEGQFPLPENVTNNTCFTGLLCLLNEITCINYLVHSLYSMNDLFLLTEKSGPCFSFLPSLSLPLPPLSFSFCFENYIVLRNYKITDLTL